MMKKKIISRKVIMDTIPITSIGDRRKRNPENNNQPPEDELNTSPNPTTDGGSSFTKETDDTMALPPDYTGPPSPKPRHNVERPKQKDESQKQVPKRTDEDRPPSPTLQLNMEKSSYGKEQDDPSQTNEEN